MVYDSPGSYPRSQQIPLRPAPYRPEADLTSPQVSPTNTTASRFHAALDSMPSRHAHHDSISSDVSDEGPARALNLHDSFVPNGHRMFDALQRELSLKEGLSALASPGISEEFGSVAAMRIGGEAEQGDTLRGLPRSRRGLLDEDARFYAVSSQDSLIRSSEEERISPTGTFDTAVSAGATTPLPMNSSSDSLSEAAMSGDTSRTRERRAGERVFPAPLLLRSNRSFSPSESRSGASSAANYLPTTAPLTFQRRPSGSHFLGEQPGSGSGSRDRPRRDGSAGSGLSSSTRSALPYQSHRPQQSSTSSTSYGSSLPYSTSPSYDPRQPVLGSSLTINTSPTSSAKVAMTSVSAPATRLPTPSSAVGPGGTPTFSSQPHPPEPPISAQALLLHVHSLRSASSPMLQSQSQGLPSRVQEVLQAESASHQRGRSAEAATSPGADAAPTSAQEPSTSGDRTLAASPSSNALAKLDTVDLSHKRIAEVPIEVVEELRNEVEKLALGYNLLRELPPHFALLGNRLKYLNIRVNLLSTFPAVLCEMPSLEILDISRNKLRKLPAVPGTLARLKVFSIAKNRIRRLPVWFTAMTQLKVLKLDHNPLEWPPPEVSTFPGSVDRQPLSKQEEADEMQRWLPLLLRWMRENKEPELEREREREADRRRVQPFDLEPEPRLVPLRTASSPTMTGKLALPAAPSADFAPGPSDVEAAATARQELVVPDPADSSSRHSRGSSLSTAEATTSTRSSLKGKKSLPDLRQSHAVILAERRSGTSLEEQPPQPDVPHRFQPLRSLEEEPALEATSPVQTSARDALPEAASDGGDTRTEMAPALVRSVSEQPTSRTDRSPLALPTAVRKGTTPEPGAGALPCDQTQGLNVSASMENERNSGAYFRRQSMLPGSTIAKAVPESLLRHIETVRGILFSISQVHAALRQFVVYAAQERLAGPVSRLMSSSDASTSAVINALDRFDSLSHRGLPPIDVIRDVFRCCQQSVELLRNLIDGLQAPLRGLTNNADLRYTRTLLIMLFGSLGEIAQAWSTAAPGPPEQAASSVATLVLQPPTPSSATSPPPRIPESGVRLTRQRSVTRRHAGSFSVEDVEMGANLPPAIVPPLPPMPGGPLMLDEQAAARESGLGGGTVRARPAPPGRRPSASTPLPADITVPPPSGYDALVQKAFEQPMTPGGIGLFDRSASARQASLSDTDIPPMPAVPPPATPSVPISAGVTVPASFHPHRISRPVSTLNADETFIDQADSTVSIASDVYGMLLDSFEDPVLSAQFANIGRRRLRELIDLCNTGNETTQRLEKAVERVRGDDGRGRLKFTLADARRLGDASFDFVQNVIRSAKLIKMISQDFAFPLQMREAVGQLTLGTREFARLLSHAQTSFRPTQVVDRGGAGMGGGPARLQEGLAGREGHSS